MLRSPHFLGLSNAQRVSELEDHEHGMASVPSQEQAGSWAGHTVLQQGLYLFTCPPTVNESHCLCPPTWAPSFKEMVKATDRHSRPPL